MIKIIKYDIIMEYKITALIGSQLPLQGNIKLLWNTYYNGITFRK